MPKSDDENILPVAREWFQTRLDKSHGTEVTRKTNSDTTSENRQNHRRLERNSKNNLQKSYCAVRCDEMRYKHSQKEAQHTNTQIPLTTPIATCPSLKAEEVLSMSLVVR